MVITYAEKCILKIHFSVTIQFLFFKFSLYLDIKLQSEHIQSIWFIGRGGREGDREMEREKEIQFFTSKIH